MTRVLIITQSAVTVSPTLIASVLASALAGVAALSSYLSLRTNGKQSHGDVIRPFFATAAVLTVCVLVHPFVARALSASVISIVPLMTFLLIFIPWNTFAFRYAGWGHLLTRRRTLIAAAPVVVLFIVYSLVAVGVLRPAQEFYSSVLLAASTLLLGSVAFTTVSSGLVLLAAHRHESMPLMNGLIIVIPVAVLVSGIQIVSLSQVLTRDLLAAIHLLVAAGALPVAIVRYDVLRTRPGTSTLGERIVVEEFNEAVLVVSMDGEIVRSNRRAEELFGGDVEGEQCETILGYTPAALREQGTVEQWTDCGYKRFDVRVSTVGGGDDQTLGYTMTLIDVTNREMLQQRIQVLNRILRHNVRNKIDVVNAHVETLRHSEEVSEEQLASIATATGDIEQVSAKARQIEKLTRNPSDMTSTFDLATLVSSMVETLSEEHQNVTVTVDVPSLMVSLDRSLLRFSLRNLIENAITHNTNPDPRVDISGERTESGLRLVVADNGPGIPELEWEIIQTGQEEATAHATSIGLWGTKWAVWTLSGELSLEDSDLGGSAVVINLPVDSD